tara:strand:- start:332 stop:646 length:315 start_codon:yes stop_codon:yes gene_type:complete
MKKDSVVLLQDPQFLMILLAAVVKKYGGDVSLSVDDVESLGATEALALFKNTEDPEGFILKIVNSEDYQDVMDTSSVKKSTKKKQDNVMTPERYAAYDDEEWEN